MVDQANEYREQLLETIATEDESVDGEVPRR
jgi:hypothetical protein